MPEAVLTVPHPTKPIAARRWRPQFLLRTLLLFVLTLASAATLWWNWGPWHLAYLIEENAPIRAAGFSPDGQYVYTLTEPDANAEHIQDVDDYGARGVDVTLRLVHTGAVHLRTHAEGHSEVVKFSPSGKFVY